MSINGTLMMLVGSYGEEGSFGEGGSREKELISGILILKEIWMEFEGRCSTSGGSFLGGKY